MGSDAAPVERDMSAGYVPSMNMDAAQLVLSGALMGAAAFAFAVLLLNVAWNDTRPALAFIAVVLAATVTEMADVAGFYGRIPAVDLLFIPVFRGLAFLLAPMLWAHMITSLGSSPRSLLPHLLPALIVWGIFLATEGLQVGGRGLALAFWLVFSLHACGYGAAMLHMLIGRLRGLKDVFSTLPDTSVARLRRLWLVAALPVLSILVELLLARLLPLDEAARFVGGVLRMVALSTMLVLIVTDLMQPPEPENARAAPYARSRIPDPDLAAARILAAMDTGNLHRDPLLTLNGLARAARMPEHHVSQVLNQRLGLSFYDFVNGHRIDEAKTILAASDASVLDVAYDVGFNSRSTFYAAFRKITGQTPSAFRSGSRA